MSNLTDKPKSAYVKSRKTKHNRTKKLSNNKKKKERKIYDKKTASRSLATRPSPSSARKSTPTPSMLPVSVKQVNPYVQGPVHKNQNAIVKQESPYEQDRVQKDQGVIADSNNIRSQEKSISAAAAVHSMEEPSASSVKVSNNNQQTISHATRVTASAFGVFGGIVLIAAAVLYVARKRKRNSMVVTPDQYDENDENKLQDISLSSDSEGEDDEGVTMKNAQPPRLKLAFTHNKEIITNKQPELHYYQQQYLHHHNYYQQQLNAEQKSLDYTAITIHNEEREYRNTSSSTDYQSMSETLIGSETTNRSSVSTTATKISTPPAVLSPRPSLHINCRQSRASSWRSSGSSIYTDALASPTSTVASPRVSTFFMIAERQHLKHERPNILDHYGELKSSRSTPIETYQAQLSPVVNTNNEEKDDGDVPSGDIPLPFFDVINIQQEIFIE